MLFDYTNVLVFLGFSLFFVGISLFLSSLLAPRIPNEKKSTPYECGEVPVGSPWIRFHPRYYLFALIFLIFEVELLFLFPCATLYKEWVNQGLGFFAFFEIGFFVFILGLGFVYLWKENSLTWVKDLLDDFDLNEIS